MLASESDPAVSEAFSSDDYTRTLEVLERFYSLVLTDCGTGLMHSAMSAVLANADTLIVVSSGSVDGARSASATLDWLDAHGHEELVRNSVAVINAVRPRSGKVDMQKVVDHFSRRCRAVRLVPFDPHLEEGAEISLDRLKPRDPGGVDRIGGRGRRRVSAGTTEPDVRVASSGVVVAVAEPPQEVGIVVGADHACLSAGRHGTAPAASRHRPEPPRPG